LKWRFEKLSKMLLEKVKSNKLTSKEEEESIQSINWTAMKPEDIKIPQVLILLIRLK
jgi:hypothetical protein